jgi:hypothetical protein
MEAIPAVAVPMVMGMEEAPKKEALARDWEKA